MGFYFRVFPQPIDYIHNTMKGPIMQINPEFIAFRNHLEEVVLQINLLDKEYSVRVADILVDPLHRDDIDDVLEEHKKARAAYVQRLERLASDIPPVSVPPGSSESPGL